MRRPFIIVAILSWIVPRQATANILLHGRVSDLAGAPVAQAYVDVQDVNHVSLANTSTNGDGHYELTVPGRASYQVGVSVWRDTDDSRYTVLSYIPTTREVVPEVNEARADITVRPGGNIIVEAYDTEGKLLRNAAFTAASHGFAEVTDLDDLPNWGIRFAVHDSYSRQNGWNWDLAMPAFGLPPGVKGRLHVLWNVTGFGQVVVDIDNDGLGYQVNAGEYIVCNLNHEAANRHLPVCGGLQ